MGVHDLCPCIFLFYFIYLFIFGENLDLRGTHDLLIFYHILPPCYHVLLCACMAVLDDSLWCLLLSQFQLGRVRVQAEASCSLSATFFSMLLFHFTPDFLECIGVVRRRVRVLGLVRVRVFENCLFFLFYGSSYYSYIYSVR